MLNKNCYCYLDHFDTFACFHGQTHSTGCNMNNYHSHYIKEISVCSLSDQYSENIPINPIRRVYKEDNELKFRYVSEKIYIFPCRIYEVLKKGLVALNSY